jgi:hypothetical protein
VIVWWSCGLWESVGRAVAEGVRSVRGTRRGRSRWFVRVGSGREDVDAWEEVVVEDVFVAGCHSGTDRDVGVERGVKPDDPAVFSSWVRGIARCSGPR